MIGNRMTTLLRAAAAGLRDGRAMPDHEFLVEHDVTLDEAYDVADLIAAGIDLLLEVKQTSSGRRLLATAVASEIIANEKGR